MTWFPGEALLIRLWETLEKMGIGLVRPLQIRREGRAQAEVEHARLLAVARAEMDVADLRAGRKTHDLRTGRLIAVASGSLLSRPTAAGVPASDHVVDTAPGGEEPAGAAPLLIDRVHDQTLARDLQRAINIEKIIGHAENAATDAADKRPPDATVDQDWFARWREGAQDVSDDDVQKLWARVLAGEVQAPGRYSLRTMDFLRSVSRVDAEAIQRLGPYVFHGRFIYKIEEHLEAAGLPFGRLLDLAALGLISGLDGLGLQRHIEPAPTGRAMLVCQDMGMLIENIKQKVSIGIYSVTQLGEQVLSLGKFQADAEYLRKMARSLSIQWSVIIKLGKAQPMEGGGVGLLAPVEVFPQPAGE